MAGCSGNSIKSTVANLLAILKPFLVGFIAMLTVGIVSIITIESKNKVHHRQPLIINKSKINDYLNLKNNASEVLLAIKSPELDYYRIGPEINNPKNNYKELINPLPN